LPGIEFEEDEVGWAASPSSSQFLQKEHSSSPPNNFLKKKLEEEVESLYKILPILTLLI
jgi:hypothetical protein